MKSLIYILLAIVFFNIGSVSLYYLGVISNYYLVFYDNMIIDIVITNGVIFIILGIYSVIYYKWLIGKFNYAKTMIMGIVLGIILSLFIPNLILEEYLFIILFTSFSLTFISYSIYFESIKDNVFN